MLRTEPVQDFAHYFRVAEMAGKYGSREWLCGLLHDVVEDEIMGYREVPWNIRIPVGRLSRCLGNPHETYLDYIHRVQENSLAVHVKICDLKDNLARMDEEHESLRKRYETALDILEAGVETK